MWCGSLLGRQCWAALDKPFSHSITPPQRCYSSKRSRTEHYTGGQSISQGNSIKKNKLEPISRLRFNIRSEQTASKNGTADAFSLSIAGSHHSLYIAADTRIDVQETCDISRIPQMCDICLSKTLIFPAKQFGKFDIADQSRLHKLC